MEEFKHLNMLRGKLCICTRNKAYKNTTHSLM